ncbi:uncharacterized protein BP5553_08353 [Venustampulla echinocandica]|uniref:Chromo domain-containing protein n=1 Tax=Venustampulla echinocandica TaxID=2656787 RepID=A0A370TGH1_9HELO|nr:uncharacterized protein BP5553_08353 [Venustampulla echinocandica]RDL33985.1 hypothetical protein BP5553_08353 [Venustampulla echinocandica]
MFRKPSIRAAPVDDDDDDDSISINSTESSQYSESREFEVERVLAEKTDNGKKLYLLEWKGYPLNRATWEPKDHIYDHNILVHWKETKSRESRGVAQPFNIKKFEADVEKLAEEKAERHRQRKLKRRRSGLPVSESDSESYYLASDSDSVEEAIAAEDERDDDPGRKNSHKPPPKPNKPPKMQSIRDKGSQLSDTNPKHPPSSLPLGEPVSGRGSHQLPANSGSNELLPQRASKATPTRKKLSVSAKENSKDLSKPDNSSSRLDGPSVPAGRGKGASRGGSIIQKNVFAIRNLPRKRSTLLQTSADPTKEMKHFKNMHIVRKAELASRALEDAAPDINAAGGLFRPGEASTFRHLKVADLRRNSATSVTRHGPTEEPHTSQKDSLSSTREIEAAPSKPALVQTPVQKPYLGPEVCYYWNSKGSCAKGYLCTYMHRNEPGVPVAPNPSDKRDHDRQHTAVDDTGLSNSTSRDGSVSENASSTHAGQESQHRPTLQNDRPVSIAPAGSWVTASENAQVCWFWHTRGDCSKGELCRFRHTDDQSIPLAPDPSRPAPVPEHAHPPSRRPTSDRNIKVCPFWKRGDCHHGTTCWYFHDVPDRPEPEPPYQVPEADRPSIHPSRLAILQQESSQCVPATQMDNHIGFREHDSTELFPPVSSPRRQNPGLDLNQLGMTEGNPSTPKPVTASAVERSKISIEDYRQNQAAKAQGSRTKLVTFGMYEQQPLLLDTGDTCLEAQHPLYQLFLSLPHIQFDQVCIAQDFGSQRSVLQRHVLWDGSLSPVDTGDLEASKIIDDIVKDLRLRASGLICFTAPFVILCYPARAEEWGFIDCSPYPREVRLRYLLFQTNLNIDSCFAIPVKDIVGLRPPYRKALMYKIHGLSIEKLIPLLEKGHSCYNFYLLFPPTANETAHFITQWLRSSGHGCKVYSSEAEGSWDFVVNTSTILACAVLIHESVAAEIYRLPLLQEVLRKSKKVFTFWYVSDSVPPFPTFPSVLELDHSNSGQVTATRLFPHGAIIFLAPGFLIAEPERTYELLKWFFHKKLDSVTPGTWKLASCYSLADYLLNLANAKALERQRFYEENYDKPSKDAEANQRGLGFESCQLRYKIHTFLVGALYTRDISKRAPPRDCFDYYSGIPDELESPIIYADRYIDADDEQAQIKWFAGWAMGRLDLFRKFTVIGTGPGSANKSTRLKALPTMTANSSPQSDLAMSPSKQASPSTIIPATNSGPHRQNSQSALNSAMQKALAVAAKFHASNPASPNSTPQPVISESIAKNHNGNVANEAVRKEILDKPGYVAPGAIQMSRGRRIVDGKPHLEPGEIADSTSINGASAASTPPDGDRMEIDSAPVSATKNIDQHSAESCEGTAGVEWKKVQFEPTTEWYKRMKDNGDGWEHIMVDGWEQGWTYLGVAKK